jgi:uncharacterized protein YacL
MYSQSTLRNKCNAVFTVVSALAVFLSCPYVYEDLDEAYAVLTEKCKANEVQHVIILFSIIAIFVTLFVAACTFVIVPVTACEKVSKNIKMPFIYAFGTVCFVMVFAHTGLVAAWMATSRAKTACKEPMKPLRHVGVFLALQIVHLVLYAAYTRSVFAFVKKCLATQQRTIV